MVVFEQAQGGAAQAAEVGIGVAFPDAALVLLEGDVQLPVQSVLDGPMVADGLGKFLRRQVFAENVMPAFRAFLAVAEFRKVTFGQYLYGGDDVSGEVWAGRDWQAHSIRERLFWYSVEAAVELSTSGIHGHD